MKLRLHANSVRVRLNRDEVARFVQQGRIEDAVDFGGGSVLSYALESSGEADGPRAVFREGTIRVELPAEAARAWATGTDIGIEGDCQVGADTRLSILVEKDFQCLHAAGGPDPDAYPNPLAEPAAAEHLPR